MPRLNNDERNQAVGMLNAGMLATVVSRHFGCTWKTIEHFTDNSMPQEMLPTILEVVDHMWPLLPMISISSCSTYVTGIWLQQQPEDSIIYIDRLSKISWDKMFNLFMHTDRTSVKFSPTWSNSKAGLMQPSPALLTCWLGFDLFLCFAINVGLTLAMPTDAREFIAVWESILPMRASLSRTILEVVQS